MKDSEVGWGTRLRDRLTQSRKIISSPHQIHPPSIHAQSSNRVTRPVLTSQCQTHTGSTAANFLPPTKHPPTMASSTADITALKAKLYDACLPLVEYDPKRYFNQASIFDLNIIPNNDVNILLRVTQALVNEKLFKILQSEGLAWRLRSVEEARKFVFPPFHGLWMDKS